MPSAALGSDGAEAAAWRLMEGPPLDYGPATHDDAAQVLAGADGSTEAATSCAGRAAAPPGTAPAKHQAGGAAPPIPNGDVNVPDNSPLQVLHCNRTSTSVHCNRK